MSFEIKRHNWNSYSAKESPNKIPDAIFSLLKASSEDEANKAYWQIDQVAVFQGRLYDIAVPVTICLLNVLQRCSDIVRPYILELLVQLGSGEPDSDSFKAGDSSLLDKVMHELCFGVAIYFDILENGSEKERGFCIDLIGLCCDYDNSLKKRTIWWFNNLLFQDLSPQVRKLIENWKEEFG